MDRTVVKIVPMKAQDEMFCLSLTYDERLAALEELNRLGREALGFDASAPMNRSVAHKTA